MSRGHSANHLAQVYTDCKAAPLPYAPKHSKDKSPVETSLMTTCYTKAQRPWWGVGGEESALCS